LADLAEELGEVLLKRGWRLSCAESCTGGWIGKRVTDVSGSSGWFDRGFTTYSDASKVEMLGVKPATLQQYGAVSDAVAREMAEGALQVSHADVSVAVTGIAGPEGGSADKPVGTVWIAWGRRGGSPIVQMRRFSGDRENVRRATVRAALEGLIRLANEETAGGTEGSP